MNLGNKKYQFIYIDISNFNIRKVRLDEIS